jgi:hypothetical protein
VTLRNFFSTARLSSAESPPIDRNFRDSPPPGSFPLPLRRSTCVNAARATAGGEHLLMLRFLDALERETLDGFFFVRPFAQGNFVTVYRNRLTRIARNRGIGFIVVDCCRRERGAHQLSLCACEIGAGYRGSGSAIDIRQLSGAPLDIGRPHTTCTAAMNEDSAIGWFVDIHRKIMRF